MLDDSELMRILNDIPDPRKKRGVRYKFSHLLLMTIYAVECGHSVGTEVEFYVELNYEYFHNLLGIDHVPSHDTFSRIFRFVNFDSLSDGLGKWLYDNFPETYAKYSGLKVLHIDGKAVRAASEKSKGEKSIYVLNSMYEGGIISTYMKRVGDKENEISCLPDYLKFFNLEDTIVTIDAIGCNDTVIKAIHDGNGRYILPVKENNKRLLRVINEKIAELESSSKFEKLDCASRHIKCHGRDENITVHMISDTSFVYEALGLDSFYGSIARVGIIDKVTTSMENGEYKTTECRRIVITDVESIDVENLMNIKLSHWEIESNHWLLDVQLNEDRQTARKGNAVENGAMLRRFCLNCRKYDEKYKDQPLKRFLMANEHDINRVEKILFGKIALEYGNSMSEESL